MDQKTLKIVLILLVAVGVLSLDFTAFLYFARDKFSSGSFGGALMMFALAAIFYGYYKKRGD